jgi:benzaldehyde dehydrogenase (NAD)
VTEIAGNRQSPGARAHLLSDEASWGGCLFDGSWRAASSRIQIVEPATGNILAHVGEACEKDVADIVGRASIAQRDWAATSVGGRAALLRRAASLLESHRAEVIDWVMRETGSVQAKAEFEIGGAIDELQQAAAMLINPEGHLLTSADPERLSVARRVPLGVVGVITPWNFPLLLAMRSVAPALACGNSVVLKPDPQTGVVGGVLICQLFKEAGLPAGVFGLVPGGAIVGEALVTAPAVRMITFTGSTAVGRRVGELGGRALKKVALELGGNSPLLVLDDCDLKAAVGAGAFGSFFYQGQICMATSRHIVHRRIVDGYIEALAAKAAELTVGDPTKSGIALGPLINAKQRDRVHRIVTSSVTQGATLSFGGTFDGLFYSPTVLANVQLDMPAFREEIFGPVAPIIVADDDDHAVALANATEYGLAAAVQTGSLARGLRIAKQLRAGMVHINDQTINDVTQSPVGGVGNSGNGARFGSLTNYDQFTEWQWLTASGTPTEFQF